RGGESTARDIVEQKWVSKSQVSKSVERLTGMGYLTASVDDNDRRLVRLRLTDEAKNAVCDLEEATEEFMEKLFDGIEEEEIRELNRLLAKITDNVRRENEK
ncbi:MAG: MarR family winged helix-turn-helix transcriptional regulator, partial [Clostridia bacterium]